MLLKLSSFFIKTLCFCCALLCVTKSVAVQISGHADLQFRHFIEDRIYQGQKDSYLSLASHTEFYWQWNDEKDSLTFTPFFRWDQHDDERTHGDIRELMWLHVDKERNLEWKVGIGKVFWGVTESQHLVDIINQTDLIESPDGEEKLGQPMINLNIIRDWGVLEFFVLPGFRERTLAGEHGRLRNDLAFFNNNAIYESGEKENHIDYAIRWSQTYNDFDIAISHFSGTSREPAIDPDVSFSFISQFPFIDIDVDLSPYYEQIEQTGLELQWLVGNWTLKTEAIYQTSSNDSFLASVSGFEYTFFNVFNGAIDLGLLAEYHYKQEAKANILDIQKTSTFQNDTFLGSRISFTNIGSSTILFGAIIDNDYGSQAWLLEANHRLNDSLVINAEAFFYTNVDDEDIILSAIKNDDYLQIELQWFY